ncbi:hypothetical protein HPC49_46680 [Pyxidicoccus fallax]|uniref:Lipoprotein n=1 Tax=Pyxidicoccus fallax TaxID=394095 RepID=A0A848LN37_9BACT|nr:hypothetical protein [Pyxidicoccus fallax]NMO19121.1 hypothetical protein [Pyxidicoccus fallax]NPC85663.1 hypothetical protein [Pyxidicoccus fallax]
MSLRRTLLTAVLASTALLSACSLRPHYRDVVQPNPNASAEGQTVALRVVDVETNQPVKGARVLAGENYRTRMSATSDADGLVKLEVSKALLRENPLVEVVLPSGVRGYRLQLVPSGQSPAPEAAPSETPAMPEEVPATRDTPGGPQPESAPASSDAPDAGT